MASLSIKNPSVKYLATLALVVGGLLGNHAGAKTFRSKFLTLELPQNWGCSAEELDWVCQPDNPNLRNEAMVVIVTKAVVPADDTLEKYKEYLKQPRQMKDLLGKAYTTEVKYVRDKKIRDQMWVDSLQIGPEIPGFTSRYVASIKEQIAALISYHIGESVYSKWAEILDKMIDSAEIRFDPTEFQKLMKQPSSSFFPQAARQGVPSNTVLGSKTGGPTNNSAELATKLGLAAILLAVVGYLIYRRKKNSGG